MINLTKKETVQVHQVEMELQTKTKASPFIAILLLAKELDAQGTKMRANSWPSSERTSAPAS